MLHFVRNDIERLPRCLDVFRDDIGPQTSGKGTGGVALEKNLKEVGSQESKYVQYFAGGGVRACYSSI